MAQKMIYFTADQHFFHSNIVKYTHRDFQNFDEMNSVIIERYNNVVTDDDIVYHIGDISMLSNLNASSLESIVSRLKGRKILVLGNHDTLRPFTYVRMGFESIHTSLVIEYKDVDSDGFPIKKILLVHDPAFVKNYKNFDFALCGHVHISFKHLSNVINVGVDVWKFTPVSIVDIMSYVVENKIF
jgi:calcineurin-like phosphoesterase family protein